MVSCWTSMCLSVSRLDDNLSKHQCSPNLVFALILWRSGLGLVMGKFPQILTVICPRHAYIFVSRRKLE